MQGPNLRLSLAVLSLLSLLGCTDATAQGEHDEMKVLQNELRAVMQERLLLGRKAVTDFGEVLTATKTAMEAGRASQAEVDACEREVMEARVRVSALEIESIRLEDSFAPVTTPRFAELEKRASERVDHYTKLLEFDQAQINLAETLHAAGRTTRTEILALQRAMRANRFALLEAQQAVKAIQLEAVMYKRQKDEERRNR